MSFYSSICTYLDIYPHYPLSIHKPSLSHPSKPPNIHLTPPNTHLTPRYKPNNPNTAHKRVPKLPPAPDSRPKRRKTKTKTISPIVDASIANLLVVFQIAVDSQQWNMGVDALACLANAFQALVDHKSTSTYGFEQCLNVACLLPSVPVDLVHQILDLALVRRLAVSPALELFAKGLYVQCKDAQEVHRQVEEKMNSEMVFKSHPTGLKVLAQCKVAMYLVSKDDRDMKKAQEYIVQV